MDLEKEKLRKIFPNLAQEMENKDYCTKITSVRSEVSTAEKAVSRKFGGYTPDVIDFLRRCDNPEQAEEIICYMENRQEISCEYAKKLKKQLKIKGVRSFGTKKEDAGRKPIPAES